MECKYEMLIKSNVIIIIIYDIYIVDKNINDKREFLLI